MYQPLIPALALLVLVLVVLQIPKSDSFAVRMSSSSSSSSSSSTRTTKVASWIKTIPTSSTTTTAMPPRSGHVAFQTKEGQNYIFGGYVEEESKGTTKTTRYATNDLWRWDDAMVDWVQVTQDKQSTIPGPRLVSAAALVDGRPTLFGGWDPQEFGTGGIILDTVHQLDLSTMEWEILDDVTIPDGPSSRHVAVTISLPLEEGSYESDSCVLIHNHRCTDHVLLFQNGTFRKQPTSGDVPSSRGLHAATMLDSNRVILFGGAAQDGKMSNELFVLDIRTWEWKKMVFGVGDGGGGGDGNEKKVPSPRAAPCLASLKDGCVILFGGAEATEQGLNPRADLWSFEIDVDDDSDNGTWTLLLDDDDGPPPRNAATLIPMGAQSMKNILGSEDSNNSNKKYFLLQGGWAPFVKTWGEPSILSVEL